MTITSGSFLVVVAVLWVSFRMFKYKDKKRKGEKFSIYFELLVNLFFLYVVGVVETTIFPIYPQIASENNFVPFASMPHSFSHFYYTSQFKNIMGNVALFVPLGILAPLIWKNINNIGKFFLVALVCSFAIEFLQFTVFVHRVSNIDDIMLNVSGALIGYSIFKVLMFIANITYVRK